MTAQHPETAIEFLLPNHLLELLKSCPHAGAGVHNWVIRVAVRLHRYFTNQSDIARLIEKYSENCGREVSEEEIWEAITSSEQWLTQQKANPMPYRAAHRWPERNEEQIAAIAKGGPNLAELEASSPVRWADAQPHTEETIDLLFPGNLLLCAGPRKELAITRSREDWRGFMQNQQFIVPSPMTSLFGKTKNGENSMRCLANTGPRRFIVIESDQGSLNQHAAVLVHLGKFAPLALVVHSGNKSLHGWFPCANETSEKVERFFRYAVSLGADHATWTRCQFVRMPDGQRENGARQRVVYFNPAILEGR